MTAHSPPASSQRPRSICPYLGTDATERADGEAIDYPSFENRCWAGERPVSLLLTDQATLCLCSGFRQCPRFVAARAARHPAHTPAGQHLPESGPPLSNEDPISHAIHELESEIKASKAARTRSRQRWGWIGAGLIFVSVLLCGGVFAGYIGWQLVYRDLMIPPPGSVDTLAEGQTPVLPQLYVIVTATAEPAATFQPQAPSAQQQQFPQAVTPTAIVVGPSQAPAADQAAEPYTLPLPGASVAQAASPQAVEPPPNVQLEIPTRRPTPILDIPTSTSVPADAVTPTPTPTATPVLGPPLVLFSAQDSALAEGDCTLVTWNVENVRAVYYENLAVEGQGEREECMDDRMEDYVLTVILPDGSMRYYTTTVDYIPPTRTPEPKPTVPVVTNPTPTWTPWSPTATATPQVRYGVRLDLNGDAEVTCEYDAACDLELLVTNTGDGIDNLTLFFTEAGAWPRQLCRVDGVCSEDHLTIANIGPTNSAVIRLEVTVPEDALDETMTYRLVAQSQAAPDAKSEQITLRIHAK